jgi:hypothetical protein
MYCPVCFRNTLNARANGVVKLSFNGKSRNTSLFTYNTQKESGQDLLKKLREKVMDFMGWYSEFNNKTPIKAFEIYSGDFLCSNGCKIDMLTTKVSVVGVLYTPAEVRQILEEEATKFGVEVQLPPH